MEYGDSQLYLLKKVSEYIKKKESLGIDTASSSLCYFPTWTNDPGLQKLKIWKYGNANFFSYFKICIRNLISTAKYSKFNLYYNKFPLNYEKVILSFATKDSFENDGSFTDRLLNINSKKNTNIIWFLVSSDNYVPKNIQDNICILVRKRDTLYNHLIFYFKTIIKTLINEKFNIIRFSHQILCDSIYSNIVANKFLHFLKKNKIKLLFMPYEGQPFNNKVSEITKKYNKNIYIIGYHSAVPPLPTNMIHRQGAPDKLIISGKDQFYYLSNLLNWDENKLKILPSLRFNVNTQRKLNGLIFLPYVIFNYEKIISLIERLLTNKNENMKYYFEPKNHPLCKNSEIHIKLILEINKLYKKYKIKKNTQSINKSIYIGPTSAVLESLEKKVDVYHICGDPTFEAYSSKIWPNILVNKIDDSTFHYKLVKASETIKFGNDDNIFDKDYINE